MSDIEINIIYTIKCQKTRKRSKPTKKVFAHKEAVLDRQQRYF